MTYCFLDLLMKYPFQMYEEYLYEAIKLSKKDQLVNNVKLILSKSSRCKLIIFTPLDI